MIGFLYGLFDRFLNVSFIFLLVVIPAPSRASFPFLADSCFSSGLLIPALLFSLFPFLSEIRKVAPIGWLLHQQTIIIGPSVIIRLTGCFICLVGPKCGATISKGWM